MKPLQLSKPHIVIMVGIPGSGKSFFAEHFSETFGAPLVSFDKIRDSLFAPDSRSDAETSALNNASGYMLTELLKTHRTIVYDGPSSSRVDRMNLLKEAKTAGYEALLVWSQTDSETAKLRSTKTTRSKQGISSNEFSASIKRFTPPSQAEHVVVISGKHTYASQLKIVLKHLVEPRIEAIDRSVNNVRSVDGRRIAIR
jgi:predicted kinase